MAIVLINDPVKKYLLGRPRSFRERIRRKFEFLESGLWEGRLRTKKLKGLSSKCVFEVAAGADLRLLFTLGPSADPAVKGPIVYAWAIATHDELDRKTKQVLPANAPFLNFQDYDEALAEDVDLEDLEPACFTQEPITAKTEDESGSQHWYPVEESEWKRIRRYRAKEFELFLHLTPEQRELLASELPILVSGTAGSGKTTLAVYYLLRREERRARKVFISYNRHLKQFAEKLFDGLVNEAEEKDEIVVPDFRVFKDFLLETARRAGRVYAPENEVDFRRFCGLYASHPLRQKFDPTLVWEEIRSILKGALPQVDTSVLERGLLVLRNREAEGSIVPRLQQQFLLYANLESLRVVSGFVDKFLQTDIFGFVARLEKFLRDETRRDRVLTLLDRTLREIWKRKGLTHKKYLSFLEYEFLGKKKAPNFQYNRKELYPVAEWYQNRCDADGLWDELDLARDVLKIVSSAEGGLPAYDLLACDEIQDFTDVQIGLLLTLVRDPRRVFFAGDTKQTINPSGFRWEEVRRLFYERGLEAPPLRRLTLNFRSSGSIVELSNVLLGLKEKYLGVKSEEGREEWKYKGRPAAIVAGIGEAEMLDILRTAGARRTILVRSENERLRLRSALATELVFTVAEAKGLEFETVVLWKFCEDERQEDVWKSILALSPKNVHEARMRHEINLLYVGLTRSQKDLIVYDGPAASPIWSSREFAGRVYATADRSYLGGIWNVLSTPKEWIAQGHYFFEREFFRAAAECYKNGGNETLFAKASAFEAEKAGDHAQAARAFETIGERERAARNYEQAGEFELALPLWEALRRRTKAAQCRIEVLKKEGKHGEAGRLYLSQKKYQEALVCFRKASDFRAMAAIYLKPLKNLREAAACLEQAQEYAAAARLYLRLKSTEKAAALFFKTGDFPSAEVIWKKTGQTSQLLTLYERTGRFDELLKIYEVQKNYDRALKILKSIKDKSRLAGEAEELFARRKYFGALLRFAALGQDGRTAECHWRLRNYEEAARAFKQAGDSEGEGRAYLKLKDPRRALVCFLDSETDERNGHPQLRRAAQKVRDVRWIIALAHEYFRNRHYLKAEALYSVLDYNFPEVGFCRLRRGDVAGAFEAWNRMVIRQDFERLVEICRTEAAEDATAKFFLHKIREALSRAPGNLPPDFAGGRLVRFMDAYFARTAKPEEMGFWGKYLGRFDHKAVHWETALRYLERAGDAVALMDFAATLRYGGREVWPAFKKRLAKDIPALEERRDWDGLAFRDLVLHNGRGLAALLPRMVFGAGNFICFLFGGEEHFRAAVAWAEANGRLEEAWETCRRWGRYDRAALACEKAGRFEMAAEFHLWGGDLEKAVALYLRLGRPNDAGDIHFRRREFKKALAFYATAAPPDDKRLARTHEKLGDFAAALRLWNKAGDIKAAARCRAKLEKSRQLDLFRKS